MTMRLLIVGGSDAGISAALRAHELDPSAEITVLLADDFPNYSICGLPFYLSGETPDWKSLAHRTQFDGITVCRGQEVTHIGVSEKTVSATERGGRVVTHGYEKLVIATGASPVRPAIAGLDLPGVFPLHTPSVLQTAEPTLGEAVAAELERNCVIVRTDVEAHDVSRAGDHLRVSGSAGFEQDCEMVLIAVGVKPNARLGAEAGIQTGTKGRLQVNRRMETAIPDIYAAGDCGETWHRLLHRYTYLPLGTTAHKQGRCAGENAVGGHRDFAGSMGTQAVKIFDLVVARTGLRQDEAVREGYSAYTAETTSFDHKAYYPGAKQLRIRVTGDSQTGRLLGAQVLGSFGAEISKRVDIFAAALFHGMAVEEVGDLDLSYTPPLSSPWDPVQMAAHHWAAALRSEQMEAMCRK
jgi:NADPH-dependent 2,4-dienoyl-CoA reductase/sulfur reductase-like enzyme